MSNDLANELKEINESEEIGVLMEMPPEITYESFKYDNFIGREVLIDGIRIGEFHLSFKNVSDKAGTAYIQNNITKRAGLIDDEFVFDLEYNVFMKMDEDSLEYMSIHSQLEIMDDSINESKKGEQNG